MMRPINTVQMDGPSLRTARNSARALRLPPGEPRLLYVGAIRRLYERDGVAVPECLSDGEDLVMGEVEKVGVEVSVFVQVRFVQLHTAVMGY